jgi:bact_gcp: putative glycoprotease GCP
LLLQEVLPPMEHFALPWKRHAQTVDTNFTARHRSSAQIMRQWSEWLLIMSISREHAIAGTWMQFRTWNLAND